MVLDVESKNLLEKDVVKLSEELNTMLNLKNRIAEIDQELLSLKPEQHYFEAYYEGRQNIAIDANKLSQLTSDKLLSLWVEDECSLGKKVGFFKKLLLFIRFSRAALTLFSCVPQEAIPFVQELYYKNKTSELREERKVLEEKLKDYHFDAKMKELRKKSMKLFKADLAYRYHWKQPRAIFERLFFADR